MTLSKLQEGRNEKMVQTTMGMDSATGFCLSLIVLAASGTSENAVSDSAGGGYDLWEEFAVMHLEGVLAIGMLFLQMAALGGGVFLAVKAKGWKKAGILFGYLCLALWTLFCGMPGMGQARERARRIACQSNLKQIYNALELYAKENAGAYPPDLRTLFETDYLMNEDIYRCPSRRSPNPEFSDYQYLGSGHRIGESAFPLLRDLEKIIRENTVISSIPTACVPLPRSEKKAIPQGGLAHCETAYQSQNQLKINRRISYAVQM